jgi:quercetin dioxygenase-like cupin family protein
MKKKHLMAAALVTLTLTACGNAMQVQAASPVVMAGAENTDTTSGPGAQTSGIVTSKEDLTFPIGMQIQSDTFTGEAYISPMIMNDTIYNFPQTNNITFAPGARSGWHSHGGMVILATGGVGYYQEEGKPAQIIRKGDVIECPEGVRHWHGATPDSWFSQVVIYDSHYTPAEGVNTEETAVSDEYYANLETENYSGRTVTEDNEYMFQRAENSFPSENFNGPVYVSSIIEADNVADAPGLHYVVFDKGVINNWHTHEGGQILIATDGIGYHQVEGGEVEVLYPGDVALCPPGVKHWHGGSADTSFAHIAVNTNPELTGLEWFDRISDEEYAKLPTEK